MKLAIPIINTVAMFQGKSAIKSKMMD